MAIHTIQTVLPYIYCYSTPGISYHEGYVKIGYTEQNPEKRIAQQTKTAGIHTKIEWTEFAVYKDGSNIVFSDDDFKAYLDSKGVNHINGFGEDGKSIGDEWYEISPEQAKAYLDEFSQKPSAEARLRAYTLREEQKDAVKETKEAVEEGKEKSFLWNAKPRFGKCLSCYDFIKAIDAKKVLIVTNRPTVVNSWYDDYMKFMGRESGYFFVSHLNDVKGKDKVIDYPEYAKDKEKREKDAEADPMGILYFVSLQDIKGSIYFGGDYEKLKEVSTVQWDVMVIDESHEGVDTYRTDAAFDRIHRNFTLSLSGTPFKAIANGDFDEDSIYNWTYVDEQEAKLGWDGEGKNPYAQMPRLNITTYDMSHIIGVDKPDLSDNDAVSETHLNEFFRTEKIHDKDGNVVSRFVYDTDIDKFLDTISSDGKYPFGNEEMRSQFAHTFWLLYRVDAAKLLAKKLEQHPVFSKYKIVVAAGDGKTDDDEKAYKSAYQAVTTAIAGNPRTITLSVGQLTTGVTIPQWTGVMMLSERNSPAEYMQASFRVQNPYVFIKKNAMTGKVEHYRKEEAFVFDFNPEHTLDIVEQFANNLYAGDAGVTADNDTRRHNITQLLKYLPVTGENENGEMQPLDAEQVMLIPRKMRSQEVVRRGFMCDALFQNISHVFHITDDAKKIVDKLPITDGHGTKQSPLSVTPEDAKDMHLDEEGNVNVSKEEAEAETRKHIPDSAEKDSIDKVKETAKKVASTVDPNAKGKQRKTEKEKITAALAKKAQEEVLDKIKATHPDLSKQAVKDIKRNITENAKKTVEEQHSSYTIGTNTRIEAVRKSITKESSEEEKHAAAEQEEQIKAEEKQKFEEGLVGSVKPLIDDSLIDAEKTVMEAEANQKKDSKLDEFKKHLKGFSRTIPSFLMAYGSKDFRLDNLEEKIPEDVFQEVTSITLDEFKILRDKCQYFDATVFDDAVQEFLKKRDALSDYFTETATEDIFDYIPPQKTNQIFTPRNVVNLQLDLLEKENPGCFDDPDNTFIDPYMKSGLYITEIVKRLYRSTKMKQIFPNDTERLQWIFMSQVYGLAPTKIIYAIATHYIFGFENTDGIIVEKDHFKCFDALPSAQKGTLKQDLENLFDKCNSFVNI